MTSLSAGARDFPPQPLSRDSLLPLPPCPAPTRLRLPATQSPYLLSQRLAVRDESRHLPAIATAALGHGVLAAWATRARAPGMIGEHRGCRSARRASARLGGRGGSAPSSPERGGGGGGVGGLGARRPALR